MARPLTIALATSIVAFMLSSATHSPADPPRNEQSPPTAADAEFGELLKRTQELKFGGNPAATLEAAVNCQTMALRSFGADDLRTMLANQQFASALLDVGRHSEALQILRKSYRKIRDLTGDDSENAVAALGDLAVALDLNNMPEEAEQHYRDALKRNLSLHGEHATEAATVMHNLAVLLLKSGRLAEADQLERQALRIRRLMLGKRHPLTIQSMNTVGLIGLANREIAVADPLIREATRLAQEELPKDSPLIGETLQSLALVESVTGRLSQAIRHMSLSVEIIEKAFGKQHLRTLDAKRILAEMKASSGSLDEASNIYADLVNQVRNHPGEDSEEFVGLMTAHARLLSQHGHGVAAEGIFRELLALNEKHFGRKDGRTARAMLDLAKTIVSHDPKQCISLSREALSFYETNEPPNSLDTAAALNTIGSCEYEVGNIDVARRAFERSIDILARATGRSSVRTLSVLLNLVQCQLKQGDIKAAEKTFDEGFGLLAKTMSPDRDQLGVLYISVRAQLRRAQGRIAEAEADEKFVADITQKRRR